jgi:hypothetical protein
MKSIVATSIAIFPRPLSRWSASALPKQIERRKKFLGFKLARFNRSERARWYARPNRGIVWNLLHHFQ